MNVSSLKHLGQKTLNWLTFHNKITIFYWSVENLRTLSPWGRQQNDAFLLTLVLFKTWIPFCLAAITKDLGGLHAYRCVSRQTALYCSSGRAALKASRALARVRQKPLEAGISGKSGSTTPAGRPVEAAAWDTEDQSSNLAAEIKDYLRYNLKRKNHIFFKNHEKI